MSKKITRRECIRKAGLLAAGSGALLGACATIPGEKVVSAGGEPRASSRKRVLTIAHLTDIHVKPEGAAPAGMEACLRHVHARNPRPDVIFNGGDGVMDVLGATEERARVQWALWKKILAAECTIPIEHCIGNHDIWGWQRTKSKTTGNEPRYGKVWAMEVYGLKTRYRSFDRAGWHFIVLDSVQYRGGEAYKPVLDDEQFEWLTGDLAAVDPKTPILILSHVPILAVGEIYFYDDIVKNYQFHISGALMHQDTKKIKDLLYKHPNVKVCLSGHTHLLDRVDYNGITYLCNGAVCGSWWHGAFHETSPGYAVVTLYDDGSFDHEYVYYLKETRKAKA